MTFQETYSELEKWRDEQRRTFSGPDLIHALEAGVGRESDPVRLRILNIFLAREHIAQGNQAAADAIHYNDPIAQIHRWHDEWRVENPEADIIPVLASRIRSETNSIKLSEMRYIMAEEYRDRRDYAAAAAAYLDVFNNDGEPMPLIVLAGQKFFEEERPEEAMRIIDQAVEVALRSGTYRRHALAMKARIALHLTDYRTVEDVLKQIMNLKFTRGNVDIGRECDFLDALPPDSIDSEVARQYDEYCRTKVKPAGHTD
jgi:hypothetical protein